MITYNEKHQKIIESGIDEIRKTLFGNDDNLIRELLFCLDFYLDPYYKNQLSYEKEIYDLLQELAVTSNNEDIINDCFQLIGDYMTYPADILRNRFDEINENDKPYIEYLLTYWI